MPFNPFSALTSKILAGVSLALLLAIGVQTWRVNAKQHRIEALIAERAQIMAEQEVAKQRAIAARAETERTYQEIAHNADERAQKAYADGRDAASRYANAHRVPASCGPARRPAAPGQDDAPEKRDGPGDNADLVGITREDFDTLTANTLRLRQVHEWGEDIMARNLAMPAPAFGGEQ